jgi:hypothetical protein
LIVARGTRRDAAEVVKAALSDPQARLAVNAALADDAAHGARVLACRAIADALKSIATWLTIDAALSHEATRLGLGLITEIAGELATAAVSLYDVNAYYAGAVLVRQLIEVQYLVAWFAGDPDRPAEWLNTGPTDAWANFRPHKMRRVLRGDGRDFRDQEYSAHCELGGHPNPKGSALVVGYHDPNNNLLLGESQWLDLAQHLEPLWVDELVCLGRLENFKQVRSAGAAIVAVTEALAKWHAADALAGRFDQPFIDRLVKTRSAT